MLAIGLGLQLRHLYSKNRAAVVIGVNLKTRSHCVPCGIRGAVRGLACRTVYERDPCFTSTIPDDVLTVILKISGITPTLLFGCTFSPLAVIMLSFMLQYLPSVL